MGSCKAAGRLLWHQGHRAQGQMPSLVGQVCSGMGGVTAASLGTHGLRRGPGRVRPCCVREVRMPRGNTLRWHWARGPGSRKLELSSSTRVAAVTGAGACALDSRTSAWLPFLWCGQAELTGGGSARSGSPVHHSVYLFLLFERRQLWPGTENVSHGPEAK